MFDRLKNQQKKLCIENKTTNGGKKVKKKKIKK